jgi:hypothetical protein
LRFVLLPEIGRAVFQPVPEAALQAVLERAAAHLA